MLASATVAIAPSPSDVDTPAGKLGSSPATALAGYCANCALPARSAVWGATAGKAKGRDRSMLAATAWVDAAVGSLYALLQSLSSRALDDTVFMLTSE